MWSTKRVKFWFHLEGRRRRGRLAAGASGTDVAQVSWPGRRSSFLACPPAPAGAQQLMSPVDVLGCFDFFLRHIQALALEVALCHDATPGLAGIFAGLRQNLSKLWTDSRGLGGAEEAKKLGAWPVFEASPEWPAWHQHPSVCTQQQLAARTLGWLFFSHAAPEQKRRGSAHASDGARWLRAECNYEVATCVGFLLTWKPPFEALQTWKKQDCARCFAMHAQQQLSVTSLAIDSDCRTTEKRMRCPLRQPNL